VSEFPTINLSNGRGFLLISTLPGRTITATGRRLEHED